MPTLSIKSALETALAGITPELPTAWENVSYTPVLGQAYQETLISLDPINNTAGKGHYAEIGIFKVTLNYPLGNGSADALTRADLIRATFTRGAAFTSGGVTALIDKTAEVGAGIREDGWYRVNVFIFFRAEVFT